MITSNAGFLIATPTKCATTSLEAVAKRHMRNADDPDEFRIMDWDSPRRQHRMALPPGEGWGDVKRFLFVRNPYRRYMSIYTYLSAPANYSQWGAREIQGNEWGGHDESKVVHRPKMSFETFLFWLAEQRVACRDPHRRGDVTDGRAYRSPWVWLDSLEDSHDALASQPGEHQGWVTLIQMEDMWLRLAEIAEEYRLDLNLHPVHANRSTAYGEVGAEPGSKQFWGGIRCARHVYEGRTYNPTAVLDAVGRDCGCAACAVDVAAEAESLGYA